MTLCYTTLHYATSLTFRNSLWNVHNPVCEVLTWHAFVLNNAIFFNFNYPYVYEIETLNYGDPLTNKEAKLHCTNLLWEKQTYMSVDTYEPPHSPFA